MTDWYFAGYERRGMPVSPAGPGITWNPADKAPDVTLDATNLIATWNYATNHESIRATGPGRSSGKIYIQATMLTEISSSGIGIADAGASLTSPGYVGGSANAIAYFANPFLIRNGSDIAGGGFAAFAVGDLIGMAIDFGAKLAWWDKNGTVQNGGVVGSSGGIDISSLGAGPFFIAASTFGVNGGGIPQMSLNPSPSSPYSGFGPW